MLRNTVITNLLKKHVKSGFYLDYLGRYLFKITLINGLVWGGLYLSEKFIIEYLTRFTVSNYKTVFFFKNSPTEILKITMTWVAVILAYMYLI